MGCTLCIVSGKSGVVLIRENKAFQRIIGGKGYVRKKGHVQGDVMDNNAAEATGK